MKAVIAQGSKQVSYNANYDQPALKENEVRIKVLASPIQPSDLLNISGNFQHTKFPVVPGRDYAGVVIEPRSSSWYGKNVYGTSGQDLSITRDGAHAEFVAIPENALAQAPEKLTPLQASLVGVPFTTAYLALLRAHAVAGETVLVIGAGGSVGSAISQLAKSHLFKCQVVTAGRGPKYDIDTSSDTELKKAKQLTRGHGPDVVVDTTGDLKLAAAGLTALSHGGRLTIITTGASRGLTETDVSVDFKTLYRMEHSIIGCNSFDHTLEELGPWMQQIATAFDAGELQAPDASRFTKVTIDDIAGAYEKLVQGSRDRFILEVTE